MLRKLIRILGGVPVSKYDAIVVDNAKLANTVDDYKGSVDRLVHERDRLQGELENVTGLRDQYQTERNHAIGDRNKLIEELREAQSEARRLNDALTSFVSVGIEFVADRTKNGKWFVKIVRTSDDHTLAISTQRMPSREQLRTFTAVNYGAFFAQYENRASFGYAGNE